MYLVILVWAYSPYGREELVLEDVALFWCLELIKIFFTSGTKWSTNNWQELRDIIRRHGACGPQWLFNWHGGDLKLAGVANFQGRWTLPMFMFQREEIVILMQSSRTVSACTQLCSPALSRRLPRKSTKLLSSSSTHISGGKAWMCYPRGCGFRKTAQEETPFLSACCNLQISLPPYCWASPWSLFTVKTSNSEDQPLKIRCKNLKTRHPHILATGWPFSTLRSVCTVDSKWSTSRN